MSKLIDSALKIATDAHYGVYRKYFNIPYISHPLEVMKRLTIWEIEDEQMLAAALLHDAIEDAKKEDRDRIARDIQNLGGKIYSWVSDLTIYDGVKKEDYIQTFSEKPLEVLIVKMADRICNLNDFFLENSHGYFPKYLQKSKVLFDIYKTRKDEVFMKFGSSVLLNIDRSLLDLENLATKEY